MALLKGEGTHQILYGSVDIFSGLRHNRGYLARPDHSGAFPTVLLVHGADGISSSIKSVARRLARQGFAVVGPDLHRGTRQLRQPAPPWPSFSEVNSDLSDTFHWVESTDTPWVHSGSKAILALDKGGAAALQLAEGREEVAAVVLISPVGVEASQGVVPILGFYGKEDTVVGAEERSAAQAGLGNADWVLYGGAGHGLVDESAADYRWDVAQDVIDRTVDFLRGIPIP